MPRRYGTFRGGIDPSDDKQATIGLPIQPCPPLRRLRVPLAYSGAPAEPLVKPGDSVAAGQRIAQGTLGGPDVFAPADATVAGVTTAAVAVEDGFVTRQAIELKDLGPVAMPESSDAHFDWRAASTETLRLRIKEGGLVAHDGACENLSAWVERTRAKSVRTLICNVMESQPLVTADHRLLTEHGTDVVRGLAILAQAAEIPDMILAVDHRRTDSYRGLVGPARIYNINRIALTHLYPIGAPAILVWMLMRREVPLYGEPMDVGVAVTNASTCLAVFRSVACGLATTGRVVTAAGDRAGELGNYYVPFGADCSEFARASDAVIVHGGPMNGLTCDDDGVVGPGTDAVLALEPFLPEAPSPCIRCGWCTDHCPVRLNVSALNDAFELVQVDRARRMGVAACLRCGVCSYVCPARLPLARRTSRLAALAIAHHRAAGQGGVQA